MGHANKLRSTQVRAPRRIHTNDRTSDDANPHAALIYVMVVVSAMDARMTMPTAHDRRHRALATGVSRFPRRQDHPRGARVRAICRSARSDAIIGSEGGVVAVVARIAYVLALDVAGGHRCCRGKPHLTRCARGSNRPADGGGAGKAAVVRHARIDMS
jgi:hypothetical protein